MTTKDIPVLPRAPEATANAILLDPRDGVAIALVDLPAGEPLQGDGLTGHATSAAIPRGHKIALRDHAAGDMVLRYGQIIGQALAPIATGDHVHSHNLGMGDHGADYGFCADNAPIAPINDARTFQGYARADGQVGTRNYIGIVTSVNCAGSVARFIAEAAQKQPWFQALGNVDGIVPIVHGAGCGMGAKGEGFDTLTRTLRGYINHPNFAAVLLVGLGCEVMQLPGLVDGARLKDRDAFRYMSIQAEGGTRRTVERALAELRPLCEAANLCTRTPQPVSKIVVGMQCGGSDGYSGITANPALGVASDMLVARGGTSILSETPEIYGAEHLLTRRATTPAVAQALVDRVKWWESYTAANAGEMNNNPSPGNKRGGLTTILEKSLGAVAKSGKAPLSGVYLYAEPITAPGFVYMDSPGYDPVSVTGQVASGANLIVFTTGRGSVSGYQPTPGLKLATTTKLFDAMTDDMDINCGDILSAGVSLADKGAEIFEAIIAAASGAPTKSEALGYGGAEFVPWSIGAVM